MYLCVLFHPRLLQIIRISLLIMQICYTHPTYLSALRRQPYYKED